MQHMIFCYLWKAHGKIDKLHLNIKGRLKYFITSEFIFTKILYHELVRDAPIVYNSQFTLLLNLQYVTAVEIPLNSQFPLYYTRCPETPFSVELTV